MDLNNRRTGKDATKPRALGLLGHSVVAVSQNIQSIAVALHIISVPWTVNNLLVINISISSGHS